MKSIEQTSQRWVGIRKLISPTLIFLLLGLLAVFLIGVVIGTLSQIYILTIIGALVFIVILMLRLDELTVVLIFAVHVLVDMYLSIYIVAMILALVVLYVRYLGRSDDHPWVMPRTSMVWFWAVLFVLAFFPTLRAPNFLYGAAYYISVFVMALLLLWLGHGLSLDPDHMRRFFQYMAIVGTLIAIHTIIQAVTGTFLFSTPRVDTNSAIISYFDGSAPGVHRVQSFLTNADSNGEFFAIMVFIPLALFAASKSLWAKAVNLLQIFLMLLALLFTYSTGAWLSAFVGLIAFLVLLGQTRLRNQLIFLIVLVGFLGVALFPNQISLQFSHASNPGELALRNAAWQTGIKVINAVPWSGLGIGRDSYWLREEPFRVPAQYIPLYHPHNSYIELAALGGIQVALVFFSLVFFYLWCAIRVWLRSDYAIRPFLVGGIVIVVVISFNSIVNAVWTLAPLAGIGWLMLGIASSPLLARKQECKSEDMAIEAINFNND